MKTSLILLVAFLFLTSCQTHYKTIYKIEAKDRNYYTDGISVSKDSIYFYEKGRGFQTISNKGIIIKK